MLPISVLRFLVATSRLLYPEGHKYGAIVEGFWQSKVANGRFTNIAVESVPNDIAALRP